MPMDNPYCSCKLTELAGSMRWQEGRGGRERGRRRPGAGRPHKYGLSSNKLALITSDRDIMRFLMHQTAVIASGCARPSDGSGRPDPGQVLLQQGDDLAEARREHHQAVR